MISYYTNTIKIRFCSDPNIIMIGVNLFCNNCTVCQETRRSFRKFWPPCINRPVDNAFSKHAHLHSLPIANHTHASIRTYTDMSCAYIYIYRTTHQPRAEDCNVTVYDSQGRLDRSLETQGGNDDRSGGVRGVIACFQLSPAIVSHFGNF